MLVVSNSSPLIALARLSYLDLLHSLYNEILIPQAVYQEVVQTGKGREGAAAVEAAPWITVQTVQDSVAVELLRDQLDRGESEAIVLAMEGKAQLLLIDEARGRRIAQSRGLTHVGTVGVIVLAKRKNLIPFGTTVLDQLIEIGFRMDASLYQRAKALMAKSD
jgi:predicted nucleic acid-binding protein